MLSVRSLSKRVGGRLLLQDFSLDVAPGEMVAVVGESGVGKSTLLNMVAGLEPFDSGAVIVDGCSLGALDDDSRTLLRRRTVGFVFQAFHLLAYLTAAENVAVPLRLLGWPDRERASRVSDVLQAVGLEGRSAAYPRELSGGETQRIAIARALVHRPRLLLADEPTGNLDTGTADDVLGLLVREVRRNAAAGLMVTHSHHAAARCDRVIHLEGDTGIPGAPRLEGDAAVPASPGAEGEAVVRPPARSQPVTASSADRIASS